MMNISGRTATRKRVSQLCLVLLGAALALAAVQVVKCIMPVAKDSLMRGNSLTRARAEKKKYLHGERGAPAANGSRKIETQQLQLPGDFVTLRDVELVATAAARAAVDLVSQHDDKNPASSHDASSTWPPWPPRPPLSPQPPLPASPPTPHAPQSPHAMLSPHLLSRLKPAPPLKHIQNKAFIWAPWLDRHTCVPAIDANFSDMTGETESGSFVTAHDCLWFNNLSVAAISTTRTKSDCVPQSSLFVTVTNAYTWELVVFSLQNVKNKSCFMNRLLVLNLDEESYAECKRSTYIDHCLHYGRTLRASEFKKRDYMAIVWIKIKVALALTRLGLIAFVFDADVLFFQVPDIEAIIATNPSASVFHQVEEIDYPALYRSMASLGAERVNENNYDGIPARRLNSGQMLWLPSATVFEAIPLALRYGVDAKVQSQGLVERAVKKVCPESLQKLSYMYVSHCTGKRSVANHSRNWITYHANCLFGTKDKLKALRSAQASWEALKNRPDETFPNIA